jgi:hypothetical protein
MSTVWIWFNFVSLIAMIVVSIWIIREIWRGKPLTWIDKIFINGSYNQFCCNVNRLSSERGCEMSNQDHLGNSPGGNLLLNMTHEEEEHLFYALPKTIRDWLMFECLIGSSVSD